MADPLDVAIAQGPGRVDIYSPLSKLLGNYVDGRKARRQVDLMDVFKDLPEDAEGNPDYTAMSNKLFQLGDVKNAVEVSKLGKSRDTLRAGTAPGPLVTSFGPAPGDGNASPSPTSATAAPSSFDSVIKAAADQHGIDGGLFRRQLQIESGFNPNATSNKGATGIAQFMPDTAKQYGVNPADPNSAIPGAAKYMADLTKQFGGNHGLALAAYNWGQTNVANWAAAGADQAKLPAETRNYVQAVTGRPIQGWLAQAG